MNGWWDSECQAPLPKASSVLRALGHAAAALEEAHKFCGIYAPRFVVMNRARPDGTVEFVSVLPGPVVSRAGATRRQPLWG